MLVVGMYGEGNVGLANCTDEEYRTHFSLWALLGSPLMIGCDIRKMNDATCETLMNREVLAINQDPAYHLAYMACSYVDRKERDDEHPIYVRQLNNGDYAIGFFNFSDEPGNYWNSYLLLDQIGLPESTGKTLLMRDLWSGEEVKVTDGIVSPAVAAHGCRLFRCKVVDR